MDFIGKLHKRNIFPCWCLPTYTCIHTHTHRFLLHSSLLLKDTNDMRNFLSFHTSYIFLTCIGMEDQFQYSQSTENNLHISDLGFHAALPEAYTVSHEGFKWFQKTLEFFFLFFSSHTYSLYTVLINIQCMYIGS